MTRVHMSWSWRADFIEAGVLFYQISQQISSLTNKCQYKPGLHYL